MDWEPEQAIAQALNVGFWDWNVGSDTCSGNDALADLFGLDREEVAAGVSAMHYVNAVHPEDRAQVYGVLSRSLVYAAGYDIAYRVETPRSVRWLRALGRCFQYDGRKRHVGVAFDITGLIAGEDPDQRDRLAFAAQHCSTAHFLMSGTGFHTATAATQKAAQEVRAALARLDSAKHG